MSVTLTATIEYQPLLDGIEFARAQRNAAMPATILDAAGETIANPALFADDSAYCTSVFTAAVKSWARMKIENDFSVLGVITKTQRDTALADPALSPRADS